MVDQITREDREMIEGFEALARRARNRKLLRWALILGPGIPILLLTLLFMGFFFFGGMVVTVVVWAVILERWLPDIEISADAQA